MNTTRESIIAGAKRLSLSIFTHYEKYIQPTQPFEENLLRLIQEQVQIAEENRLNRRIRYAGFPQHKTMDTFKCDPDFLPYLNFNEFHELATCHFIDEKYDIVALGPSGRGKTHAALAIGYEAVKRGYKVRFKRASDLVNEMSEAKTEKQLTDYIKTLNRCQLLILDEVGYLNYDINASSLLFQVVGARYECASTFYTTNLEFSKWPQFIGNENLAAAIVDRIAHHSIILNMNGPKGWRLEHARSKEQRETPRKGQ
jgi:DNA replication protein DnaC